MAYSSNYKIQTVFKPTELITASVGMQFGHSWTRGPRRGPRRGRAGPSASWHPASAAAALGAHLAVAGNHNPPT